MPKLKQVFKNIVSDKGERAEDCFRVIVKDHGIELCDANGNKVDSPSVITGIGRYTGGSQLQYCINAFKEKGIVECNNPVNIIENYTSEEVQCTNDIIDRVRIRDTVINNDIEKISIGKSINQSGKEIEGCKIIVKDFNPREGDKIDFLKLYDKTFNDVNIFDFTMNSLPAKALHIYGDSSECTVGFYNYNSDITQDMFIFNPQAELHTEL